VATGLIGAAATACSGAPSGVAGDRGAYGAVAAAAAADFCGSTAAAGAEPAVCVGLGGGDDGVDITAVAAGFICPLAAANDGVTTVGSVTAAAAAAATAPRLAFFLPGPAVLGCADAPQGSLLFQLRARRSRRIDPKSSLTVTILRPILPKTVGLFSSRVRSSQRCVYRHHGCFFWTLICTSAAAYTTN